MALLFGRIGTGLPDGEEVTPHEALDLFCISEGGGHHLGLVVVLLVVVVDTGHALNPPLQIGIGLPYLDSRVIVPVVLLLVGVLHEPVHNPADEGRDQSDPGLGTGHRLLEIKEQRHVAVDAVLRLENLGRLDPLPGGGQLDEDSILGDALLLVEGDERQRLSDAGLRVEGQTGVDLRRHAAGDNLQNFLAKNDKNTIHSQSNNLKITVFLYKLGRKPLPCSCPVHFSWRIQ